MLGVERMRLLSVSGRWQMPCIRGLCTHEEASLGCADCGGKPGTPRSGGGFSGRGGTKRENSPINGDLKLQLL